DTVEQVLPQVFEERVFGNASTVDFTGMVFFVGIGVTIIDDDLVDEKRDYFEGAALAGFGFGFEGDFEVVVVEAEVAAAAVVGPVDVKADAPDVAGGDLDVKQRKQDAVKRGGIHPPEGAAVAVRAVFAQHIEAELGAKLAFVHDVR